MEIKKYTFKCNQCNRSFLVSSDEEVIKYYSSVAYCPFCGGPVEKIA
jgi:Zn finger protein HypA/HybF involved in hydrogenase expression